MKFPIKLILVFALFFSTYAQAVQWHLVEKESSLDFVSVKNGTIVESHTFGSMSGTIESNGATSFVVMLNSVETNINIRNTRMKELLFATKRFPQALFTTIIDSITIAKVKAKKAGQVSISGVFSLHGVSAKLSADLQFKPLSSDRVLIYNQKPLIIQAEEFGLTDGIERLRKIAGLKSITSTVPVNLKLVFKRDSS